MAQDQTLKRRHIAEAAIDAATKLWDAILALKQAAAERAVAGNFVDDDFTGMNLVHLTPFMIGTFLDTTVPALVDAIDNHQQLLLEVRR